MLNSKLKTCPFCNGTVNIMYNSIEKNFYVYHDGYGFCPLDYFTINDCFAKSLSEAYEIWNTRKGEN